jgi:hypothetical protein
VRDELKLAIEIVDSGELDKMTMAQIEHTAYEWGVDIGYLTQEQAIRKLKREVKRAEARAKSYEQ